jgi:hypothetical protein
MPANPETVLELVAAAAGAGFAVTEHNGAVGKQLPENTMEEAIQGSDGRESGENLGHKAQDNPQTAPLASARWSPGRCLLPGQSR